MPNEFPQGFPPNTELTGALIDKIVRELWRWRKADGSGGVQVDNADSDEPPHFWALDNNPIIVAQNLTGGDIAAGSISVPVPFDATLLVPDSGGGPGLVGSGTATFQNAYSGTIPNNDIVFGVSLFGFVYVLTAGCSS